MLFALTIFDVGHGSAAFLETPNGRTALFDAGAGDAFSPAHHLATHHPRLRQPGVGLDLLVVSHPDQDHVRDLPEVVRLVPPATFLRNTSIPPSLIYPPFGPVFAGTEAMRAYYVLDTTYHSAPDPDRAAAVPSNWGGVELEFYCNTPDALARPTTNDLSVLSCVRYGGLSVILPGDLGPAGWEALLTRADVRRACAAGDIRVLIAPHHGRASGIVDASGAHTEFLDLIRPNLIVMSDVWGSEHTAPELYRPHATGLPVYFAAERTTRTTQVLTTKTNRAVGITHDGRGVGVTAW